MKKVICLVVLVFVASFVVSSAVAEDEGASFESGGMKQMMKMKRNMMKEEGRRHKDGWKVNVTPEELAAYDDKTKAAWLEIQDSKMRMKTGKYFVLAAAFAIGVATFGGAIAQGRVASSAMEGIARNPEASSKIFTPLMISLVLIESLVIYALVVALLLHGEL